jgi:AcrR family transcriptional regulator
MKVQFQIRPNEKLYLRDPELSVIGKKMVRHSIVMINKMGFEQFTFKKLAEAIDTTEASVYRYFENKHKLLLYLLAWYWNWLEYQVVFSTNNLSDSERKLRRILNLLTKRPDHAHDSNEIDFNALFQIVVSEGSKSYLTKDVDQLNKHKLFKPYKDLCARISGFILEYNPKYKYPHSLASTVLEMAHYQYFFMMHLPSLTDFGDTKTPDSIRNFLESLLFSAIAKK